MPGILVKNIRKILNPPTEEDVNKKKFYICGELGDIIYSLPSIKYLGGGNLYIGGQFDEFPNYKVLDENLVNQLSEILLQQPYIKNVYYSETLPDGAIDLNQFKNRYIDWNNNKLNVNEVNELRCTNISTLFSSLLKVPSTVCYDKWLTNKISESKFIIINRSLKYHNEKFPWTEIVSNYKNYIRFIGHKREYDDFCKRFGEVNYIETPELIDVFNVISECAVFIGNQSFCYSLAEGLKKNCIQETDPWITNCQYFRDNSLIFENGENCNFSDVDLFLRKNGFKNLNERNRVTILSNNKKIFYIGQSGTSGYAKAAKGYIYDFYKQGNYVDWLPLKFDSSKESRSYIDLICKSLQIEHADLDYDEIYLHCTPDLWPVYRDVYSETFLNSKKVIGYSVWETEKLPKSWIGFINNSVDILQVPSTFNKRIYRKSGITIPIEIKPHLFFKEKLFDKKDIQITSVDGKILDNNKFTFYNISEFTERKGIEDSLKVFSEVFGKNNDVQFLIKTHYKDYKEENKNYVLDKISNYINKKNIFVVIDKLSQDELNCFHSVGDCYISLHRGEAFGLVLHEAYCYGKKVVTTNYGGQTDFLGDNYEYYVNYNLQPVNNMGDFNKWYEPDQYWGVPDLEHAKEILKKIII